MKARLLVLHSSEGYSQRMEEIKEIKETGYCHVSELFCTLAELFQPRHRHVNIKMLANFDQISCVLIGKDINYCLKRDVKHAGTTTNFLTFSSSISCTRCSSLPVSCLRNLYCIYHHKTQELYFINHRF